MIYLNHVFEDSKPVSAPGIRIVTLGIVAVEKGRQISKLFIRYVYH
jgi:hypothetical protein